MWCYQKPGFEALLLAELQRQQQCSHFCDTLLKTDGVSVPAHSSVLSAISPHISSTLSSTPPPPAGQSRVLEFRALGACTLLHLVRLLYSGEMAGEGEKEKQEAISAAAKLGIHGLVEVTNRDRKGRNEEGERRHTDVGVQTEPLMPEENEGRWGRWSREVRDGSTFLWKDTLSHGEKDTWTQTEELQVNAAPLSHPAASFETIDMAALQGLGQTDPHLLLPKIPYVPISLVYPLDENQTRQPSSVPVDSTAAGHTSVAVLAPPYTSVPPSLLPFSSQATPCAADPQSWWAGPQGAARAVAGAEEWEDERFEQFQGNIPGYINYFLNPDKEEGSCRGRARRRRGAGVGGARRAGTGERRARRPRAGRGRGGLTQTVDVQEVRVSKLQKMFLQRWGVRVPRTGQGGGAVGRKLYLKTRELLKPAKSCQRRRGRGKVWEFSQSGDVMEGGGSNAQCGRRNTTQQFNQDGLLVGRAQRAKPTTSVSFSSPPMRFYNIHTLSAARPSLQPSPSPGLLSPAASYVSSASPFLHTTSLPSQAPPPHEEQPEHIDRLLEEVMMGLDILPNNNGAPHSQPPLPASSSNCTSSGKTLARNKQQGRTTGLLEAGPGFHRSTQVVAVARGAGGSSSANGEAPLLQQQGERELNEILDHLLQSFEQHVGSCTGREEVEKGGRSCTETSQPYTVLTTLPNTRTPRPVRCSQITELQQSDEAETPARRSQPHTEGTSVKVREPAKRPRKRRKKNPYPFALERKRVRVRVRKSASSSDVKTKIVVERGDKQLQQIPVVKLERRVPVPGTITLQGRSCQSLEVQSPAQTKTSSSSHDCSSAKNQPVSWSRKTYPIRSRFREAHVMDSVPFLEEPLPEKWPPSAGQPYSKQGRPKKNGQLLHLSNSESSTSPIQPQPVESSGTDEQPEESQERHEEESTLQPQEEAEGASKRGKKRRAESEEETSLDDATVAKTVCFEQMARPTSNTWTPSCASAKPAATEIEDVIDVETVSLTSAGDCLEREERKEKPAWSEIKLRETGGSVMDEEVESSGDETVDVDGDVEDGCHKEAEKDGRQSRTANPPVSPGGQSEVSLGSTGSRDEDKDEDIDVIGGSSPVPDPVIISWTESSEGEREEGDEDVDVDEEKTDYSSSAVFSAMSNGELVNRKYQTEVLLH